MPEIKKPKVESYEYAKPEVQAAMKPIIQALASERLSEEAMADFGAKADRDFHDSVQAIQTLFSRPDAGDADKDTCSRLMDDYNKAAQNMALVLGAGQEVLRRYESEYLEHAAEELMITGAEPERRQIETLIKCRDDLALRLDALAQPEKAHDTVCDLVAGLEAKRQFNAQLSQGLPLEDSVSVRKEPLRFAKPSTP